VWVQYGQSDKIVRTIPSVKTLNGVAGTPRLSVPGTNYTRVLPKFFQTSHLLVHHSFKCDLRVPTEVHWGQV